MIKRRFYREEHGDRDEPSSASSSSSSSSDSEVEADPTAESELYSEGVDLKENDESSSGYASENSSADEINADSSGANEDDGSGRDKSNLIGSGLFDKHGADILKEEINDVAQKESITAEMSDFVLKFKSVYKCRICPRIVCLTEDTMRTHLNSKRHTRSEKLLKENRLKVMLNSDGEIENQETPAEMHARILALGQTKSKKKNKGRQRQKKRSRKKKDVSNSEKTTEAKKRHKSEK